MRDMAKRISLSYYAAASIDKRICRVAPSESLPCELLHVSRPSIRTVLRLLATDILISICQSRLDRSLH